MNIFVANFDEDTTEDELEDLFPKFGSVQNVKIWIDWDSGKSKGFGFVEMPDESDAERAIEKLNWKRWRGLQLKVSKARDQSR